MAFPGFTSMHRELKNTLKFLRKLSKLKWGTVSSVAVRLSHFCLVDDNELHAEVSGWVRMANG